jgi:hypothetical protein
LGDKRIEMLVVGTGNAQVTFANIVHGFVVHQESAVRVLDRAVCRQDRIVWLNDRGRDAGRWVHSKLELAFLAIVGGKALKQKRAKSRASTAAKGMEYKKSLK